VVAKPSSDTPLVTIRMAQTILEAGFPPGVFNVITGPGGSVGESLVQHPLIRKVALTGSVEGGRQVMRVASESIKRVTLELGGHCPCIVWNDVDLDKAFEYANDTVFGLNAYFFSKNMRRCYLAAQRLEAGSIWINDIHGSFVQAPYGGMKQSGIRREQGSIAIDEYLEWKTVYQEMSYESRGARICVHH